MVVLILTTAERAWIDRAVRAIERAGAVLERPPEIRTVLLDDESYRYPWDQAAGDELRSAACVVAQPPGEPEQYPVFAYLEGACVPMVTVTDDWAQTERELVTVLERLANEVIAAHARAFLAAAGYAPGPQGLVIAATRNDCDAIEAFHDAGTSMDACDARGVPALHMAIRHRAWDAVYLLLEHGADPARQSGDRAATALAEAAGMGNPELVEKLLLMGVDPNLPMGSGQTPLMVAIGNRDATSAVLLIKAGADAQRTDALGMSGAAYARLFSLTAVTDLLPE